ncbi:MAG: thiolase family protein [Acidimicrobiales bacterium]|nr:thiolase family protein [Acidimicrobiales bacterium]
MGELTRAAAVTGIAELTPTKSPPPDREIEIMAVLARDAIADAGLRHDDIDGLLVVPAGGMRMLFPSLLAEYLGLRPTYADQVDLGGATAAGMVWRAAAAIAAGQCRAVLCVMASVLDPARFARAFRSEGGGGPSLGFGEFESTYGPMGVNSSYAMAARRHMHTYGTTSEQLAKIAVDQRTNAMANPMAMYREPLTIEEVVNARLVVDPLHLYEIVRPCSGGAAWVVAAPDLALANGRPPAWLLGAGEKITHSNLVASPDVTRTPVVESAARAFAMAGVTPADIDLVSVYDCYTIMVLLTLEDAGFCPKGAGGPFVADHDLTYAGDLPVNTHGGQLSFGQPGIAGGASHITEAVRQLRGEAGERQLADCELAFVNGNGGTMSEEASLVLGR